MHELEQNARDEALGLLLGGDPAVAGYAAADARLQQDGAFRREFELLAATGADLEDLGAAFHDAAGVIDIRDDVLDSIAHLAFEQLGVAKASPYAEVETGLRDIKRAFDGRAGKISIVDDVMAAIAAAKKSDAEVELPFARVAMELNALGTAVNQNAPEVDLVDPVMARVAEIHKPLPTVTPFRARPAVAEARTLRRRGANRSWGAWVAAATLCLGAGWVYFYSGLGNDASLERVSHNGTPGGSNAAAPSSTVFEAVPAFGTGGNAPAGAEPGVDAPTRRGIKEPVTLQDALNARRRELLAQGQDFSALASLTGDEATELLKSMDLSVEALLGAAQYLSTEDAIEVLRAAIAEHPDDPYLKYALALNLEGSPEGAEERLQQLSQLAVADPDNSMPHYMMAADFFERGDMAQALDALSKGSSYGASSAYSLESARQREAALVASGLDADTARFLALSSAGSGEFGDVSALRNELLDYGAYYEGLGDYDTAQQIYNAVNQLGVQLYEGAALAVEQQYGLETQQDAILAIQGIAEVFQQPETVALLGETLGMLAGGIVEVTQYIAARQELVVNPALSSQLDWSAFLNHVMTHGDLDVSGFVR